MTTTTTRRWPVAALTLVATLIAAGLLVFFLPRATAPLPAKWATEVIDLYPSTGIERPDPVRLAGTLTERAPAAVPIRLAGVGDWGPFARPSDVGEAHLRRQLAVIVAGVERLADRYDAVSEGIDHLGMRLAAVETTVAAEPWRTTTRKGKALSGGGK